MLCNWDVEVFDFLRRLEKAIGPPHDASPGSLLLTAGFKPDGPDELHAAHAADEVARLCALVPAGAPVVCPALTQGRIGHVVGQHASTRVWVHAGHGRGATLTCAEGGDLTVDELRNVAKRAADLELVVLSACDSADLARELAKTRVRYVVAYLSALRPEAAYHLSTAVVSAYFDQRGSSDAVRDAFSQGRQAQVEAGYFHEPVLFVDGKLYQP